MGDANFNLEVAGEGFILKAKPDPDPQVLWSSQEPEESGKHSKHWGSGLILKYSCPIF